jgi:hypothetical protein
MMPIFSLNAAHRIRARMLRRRASGAAATRRRLCAEGATPATSGTGGGRRAGFGALACAAVCLVLAVSASTALGHEDPHEVLHSLDLVAPGGGSSKADLRLLEVISRAREAGAPVKVALIDSVRDMDEVEQYMNRPAAYARVLHHQLGAEEQILVVMPAGLASMGPLPAARVDRALAAVGVGPRAGPDALARAAALAVERLAEQIRSARPQSGAFVPGLGLAAAVGIAGAGAFVARRRRCAATTGAPNDPAP